MKDYMTRWTGREPSWDVMLRERAVTHRPERARRVRPLTAREAAAVRKAMRAVLSGPGSPSAYTILERFDEGNGAFDSRHLDLLREVERRVAALRGGSAVAERVQAITGPELAGV